MTIITDIHQHVWTPEFIDALKCRTTTPRLTVALDQLTLLLPGEPAYTVNTADHDPVARAAQCGAAKIGLSLSSPLGIEYLPDRDLIDIWHRSATSLPDPYYVWASSPMRDFDTDQTLVDLIHPRVLGLQIPATSMLTPSDVDRLAPLFDVAHSVNKPVFIHPGPTAHAQDITWWAAVVPYIAQLQAAWFSWHHAGRSNFPDLRICFAALAGLAPTHIERLQARGGSFSRVDPHVFYETSSYGQRAIDAMIRIVGVDTLVNGSDEPYASATDPGLGEAFNHSLFYANPARLLEGTS